MKNRFFIKTLSWLLAITTLLLSVMMTVGCSKAINDKDNDGETVIDAQSEEKAFKYADEISVTGELDSEKAYSLVFKILIARLSSVDFIEFFDCIEQDEEITVDSDGNKAYSFKDIETPDDYYLLLRCLITDKFYDAELADKLSDNHEYNDNFGGYIEKDGKIYFIKLDGLGFGTYGCVGFEKLEDDTYVVSMGWEDDDGIHETNEYFVIVREDGCWKVDKFIDYNADNQ